MNHLKIYEKIIQQAKNQLRIKHTGVYYENHHILPICLGGKDEDYNYVLLTAKEHYICHKLLTYIYPNNRDIACALHMMSYTKNGNHVLSSRDYLYVRELISKNSVGDKHPRFGKTHTEETKRKMRKPHKPISTEYREQLKKDRKGEKNPMYGKTQSPESKEKNKLSHLGKTHSDEAKRKMSKYRKGRPIHTENFKFRLSIKFKNKTYEEIYGIEKANSIKEKLKKPKSEEHKKNLSKPRNFCWVFNVITNESHTIKNTKLKYFLENNKDYKKGRKIK